MIMAGGVKDRGVGVLVKVEEVVEWVVGVGVVVGEVDA